VLINKADLPHRWDESTVRNRYGTEAPIITMSVKRREDIEALKNLIREHFLRQALDDATESFAINKRHREHLIRALENLNKAVSLMKVDPDISVPPYELIAYELESARKELNAIVGKEVSLDDVLDRVFSQFCIGK
jgi:tRNA modification GTPase